jgi:hypothetical protein
MGGDLNDQQLALANIRFLATAGGDPEFYDMLRSRLLELAESWEGMEMSPDEYEALIASKRRLSAELAYLRNMAELRQK